MNKQVIEELWDSLAGERVQLIGAFYERLFDRYPQYRELFPDKMDHQKDKMVEMLSALARFSDHIDMIRPYMTRIAEVHRSLGLHPQDLRNFQAVLIETLEQQSGSRWRPEHGVAFKEAFDTSIIPLFEDGMDD